MMRIVNWSLSQRLGISCRWYQFTPKPMCYITEGKVTRESHTYASSIPSIARTFNWTIICVARYHYLGKARVILIGQLFTGLLSASPLLYTAGIHQGELILNLSNLMPQIIDEFAAFHGIHLKWMLQLDSRHFRYSSSCIYSDCA